MKLQGSPSSGPKILQSQTSQSGKNRIALNRLAVVHGRQDRMEPNDEYKERDRRTTNVFLLVGAAIIVGGGVWLVNAMIDAKKSEECFESGRRNCNPISMPGKQAD
jgi:hypothetical protein